MLLINKTLKAYGDILTGDSSENVTDLLADLLHWCLKNKIDFEYCLKLAKKHVKQEAAI